MKSENQDQTQANATTQEPNPLEIAERLRKQTQAPNAVAAAHEIHGEIGNGQAR